MSKATNATFAAVLLAASVVGGHAFASGGDGEYFSGTSREPVEKLNLDNFSTQSIIKPHATQKAAEDAPGDGKYFEGVEQRK